MNDKNERGLKAPFKLDRTDLKILRQLQADGRITNVELARRAGLSPAPCLRRVRALEEAGLIQGYRATLDATRLETLPAHDVPRHGIAWVPQGRRLFAELTVAENLEIGLLTRRHGPATREKSLALFPRLR